MAERMPSRFQAGDTIGRYRVVAVWWSNIFLEYRYAVKGGRYDSFVVISEQELAKA